MTEPADFIAITGASSGIGAALALGLASNGAHLALTGRDQRRLEAIAEKCRSLGAHCRTDILDVRDAIAASHWVESLEQDRPIGMMIINAGVAGTRASIEQGERVSDIIIQAQTNFTGSLVMSQLAAERMRKRGRGHLVLMSSLNGLFPVAEAPTYSASKAGLLAYGLAVRDWLEPAGVTVTTVAPGFVRTGIAERYRGPRPFEISAEQAAQRIIRGIRCGKRSIAFPWPLLIAIHLGRVAPTALRRWVVRHYTAELPPLD